jgi:hypothetical protein
MPSLTWRSPAALLLSLAALSGQNGLVSTTQLTFRMVHQGVIADHQPISVNVPAGETWTATVARDPKSDQPWLVLNKGNNPVSGAGPGTFLVGLRDWMVESKAAGTYTEAVVLTPAHGAPVNIAVTFTIVPRLPGPAFRYLGGPNGCKQTRDFPDADTCTFPGDWPSPQLAPERGTSYKDFNFGSTIHVLSEPGCPHAYSTPSAISAGNSHVLAYCNNGPQVLDAKTGALQFKPNYHNGTAVWDANNDDVYYYMGGASLMKVAVAEKKVTTLIDYSKSAYHFSTIHNGGTGDTSKDNWAPFWAAKEHQVCVVDLNNLRTYCADYTRVPGRPVEHIDFAMIAKGIDRPTGKRYVLLVANPSLVAFSVNQPAGKLDFEYRGPENPDSKGNHDGNCDAGEACLGTPHADTFEDSAGIQYLVYNAQWAPCEFALATYRLNAGPKILIDAELGGGRKRIMAIDKCSGPGPWPKDDHIGCAKKAPYCAISTTYNVVKNPQDLSPIVRTPHESELFLMHDNGAEIIRLAQLRSLRFTSDGEEGYWTQSRACLSNDAAMALADTNFMQSGKVRIIEIDTGVAKR